MFGLREGQRIFVKLGFNMGDLGTIVRLYETTADVKLDNLDHLKTFQQELLAPLDESEDNMKEEKANVIDVVNHPAHYEGKIDCIEAMEVALGTEAVKAFCRCNAFKYIWRSEKKNGLEDIKKARWYINKFIELSEKESK